MPRTELSDGAWVEFRDPEELTVKQRNRMERAIVKAQNRYLLDSEGNRVLDDDGNPVVEEYAPRDALIDYGREMVKILVESWSFGRPPAEDESVLDGMSARKYDEVCNAMYALKPNERAFWQPTPSDEPGAPTQPVKP